jgi:hypothetical protein
MVRKVLSMVLFIVFFFALIHPSDSAKKRSTVNKQQTAIRKKSTKPKVIKAKEKEAPKVEESIEEMPEGLVLDKMPEEVVLEKTEEILTTEAIPATPLPPAVQVPPPTVQSAEAAIVKPTVAAKAKSYMGELGMGGGAIVLEVLYQKQITEGLKYSGGAGYGIGSQYGIIIADLARITYDLKGYFIGGGLCYAAYSEKVADIPGIGTIPNKNLLGVEFLAGSRFNNIIGRVGYNSVLGFRLSAGSEF